ncbi:hypothetical protein R50076_30780 [Gilvimarinus japonicus]
MARIRLMPLHSEFLFLNNIIHPVVAALLRLATTGTVRKKTLLIDVKLIVILFAHFAKLFK